MKFSLSKTLVCATSLFLVCAMSACATPPSSSSQSTSSSEHTHEYVHHDKVDATCTDDGTKEYYSCSGCQLVFDKDKIQTTREDLVITKKGHDYTGQTISYTHIEDQCTADKKCKNCDHHETETVTGTFVIDTSATCTSAGEGHYVATFCDDFGGTHVYTNKVVIPAKDHEYIHHNRIDATCTDDGIEEYYSCEHCDWVFTKDHVRTTIDDLIIAASGHNYEGVEVQFSHNGNQCTAYKQCKNCTYKDAETVTGILITDIDPTCSTTGSGHYEATFSSIYVGTHIYSDTVVIPATGEHDYNGVSPTYSIEGNQCTASIKCKDCENCKTSTVTGNLVTDTPATCVDNGTGHYTATFSEEFGGEHVYSDSVVIPATGHNYNGQTVDYTHDGNQCTADVKCTKCDHHETQTVTGNLVTDTPATCDTDGSGHYVATFGDIFGGQHVYADSVVIPANGHDYTNAQISYSIEGNQCIASIRCNNCDYCKTQTVTGTLVTDTEPTCTETGIGHYEATFSEEFGGSHVYSESVVIDAKGHKYDGVEATFYHTGNQCTADKKCKNCDHHETETVDGDFVIETAATCETDGSGHYEATFTTVYVGTHVFDSEVIPAAGHDYEGVSPTYSFDGDQCTASIKCKNCTHCKTQTVTGTLVTDTAPTCTETGLGHYEAIFSEEFGGEHVYSESVVIAAKGHTLNHEAETNSTFITNGHVEGYTCSVCGKHYTDSTGETIISDEDWVKPLRTATEKENVELFYDVDAGALFEDEVGLNGYTYVDGNLNAIDLSTLELGETVTVYAIKEGYTDYKFVGRKVSKVLKTSDDIKAFANLITDPDSEGITIGGYYVLGNDITVSIGTGITHANNPSFVGTFDGRYHEIKGQVWSGGIFGAIDSATIQNITFSLTNTLGISDFIRNNNTYSNVTFNATTLNFQAAATQAYLARYYGTGNRFVNCTFNYGDFDNAIICNTYKETTFENCVINGYLTTHVFGAEAGYRPTAIKYINNDYKEADSLMYYDAVNAVTYTTALPFDATGYTFAADINGTAIDWTKISAGVPFIAYALKENAENYVVRAVKLNGVISSADDWNNNLNGTSQNLSGYYYVTNDIDLLTTAATGDMNTATTVNLYIDGGNHSINRLNVTSGTGGIFGTCGNAKDYRLTIKNLSIYNMFTQTYGLLGYKPANGGSGAILFENFYLSVGEVTYNGIIGGANTSSRFTFKNCTIDYNDKDRTYMWYDTKITSVNCTFENTTIVINTEKDTTIYPHAIVVGNMANERDGYTSKIDGVTFASTHDYSEQTVTYTHDGDQCTASVKCKNCEHRLTETVTGTLVIDTAATCEATGTGHYKATFTNELFAGEYIYTDSVEIAALGHNYSESWSSDGTNHWHTCTRCGATGDVATHTYGEWITDTEATCTTAGTKHRVCSVCNHQEDGTIPATGHNMTHYDAVEATCTTDGNVEYYHCSNCNKNFSDEAGATEIENVVITKLGHSITYSDATDSTFITHGHIAGYTCSRCNKHFEDSEGKVEISDNVWYKDLLSATAKENVELFYDASTSSISDAELELTGYSYVDGDLNDIDWTKVDIGESIDVYCIKTDCTSYKVVGRKVTTIISDLAALKTFANSITSASASDTFGGYYVLGANITANGFNGSHNQHPSFIGTFDGRGYTLSGNIWDGGLFGKIKGATIQNVTIAFANSRALLNYIVNNNSFINVNFNATSVIFNASPTGAYLAAEYGTGNSFVNCTFDYGDYDNAIIYNSYVATTFTNVTVKGYEDTAVFLDDDNSRPSSIKYVNKDLSDTIIYYDTLNSCIISDGIPAKLDGYVFKANIAGTQDIDWNSKEIGSSFVGYASKSDCDTYIVTCIKVTRSISSWNDYKNWASSRTDTADTGYYVQTADFEYESNSTVMKGPYAFKGVYDGHGHEIVYQLDYISNYGLFGTLNGPAIIKNLTVRDINTLIVLGWGINNCTIQNCNFYVTTLKRTGTGLLCYNASRNINFKNITIDTGTNSITDIYAIGQNSGDTDYPNKYTNVNISGVDNIQAYKTSGDGKGVRPSDINYISNIYRDYCIYYNPSDGSIIDDELPAALEGYSFTADLNGTAINWSNKTDGDPFVVYAVKDDCSSYVISAIKITATISNASEWNTYLNGSDASKDLVGYYYVTNDIAAISTTSSGSHTVSNTVNLTINGGNHTIGTLTTNSGNGGMFGTCGIGGNYYLTIKNLSISSFVANNGYHTLLGYQPCNNTGTIVFENFNITLGSNNVCICVTNPTAKISFNNCVIDFNNKTTSGLFGSGTLSAKFINTTIRVNTSYDESTPNVLCNGNLANERDSGTLTSKISGVTFEACA